RLNDGSPESLCPDGLPDGGCDVCDARRDLPLPEDSEGCDAGPCSKLDLAYVGLVSCPLCTRKHVHTRRDSEGCFEFSAASLGSRGGDCQCFGRGEHSAQHLSRKALSRVCFIGRNDRYPGISVWNGLVAESCHGQQ